MNAQVRLRPPAIAQILAGLACVGVGAYLGSHALVALGGAGSLAVLLDVACLRHARGRAALDVSPNRVPEDGFAEVSIDPGATRSSQQAIVPLEPAMRIEGTNLGSGGPWTFRAASSVRGPRSIGPVLVRSWGPARWACVEQRATATATLEVIPRTEDAERFGLRNTVLKAFQGRFQANKPGQGFDFFTLRPYQPSDSQRDVNWKATARRDDLIVNQRLRETQSEITFLLDARLLSGVGPAGQTPLDRSCRIVLGLLRDAVRARDIVHLVAYGDGVRDLLPDHGEHIHQAEGSLSRLAPAGDATLADAWAHWRPELSTSGPVLLFSSGEGDATLAPTLAQVRASGHAVTWVSPCPVGPAWEAAGAVRHAARLKTLDAARATGIMVVDWGSGQALVADAPEAVGVAA